MIHYAAFLFVSILVSLAFAMLMRKQTRERVIFGAKMFFGLLAFALITGWVIYFLP